LISLEPLTLTAIMQTQEALKSRRELILGGAVTFDSVPSRLNLLIHCAGLIDRKLLTFGRTVARTAVQLNRGEHVESVITIPIDFDGRRVFVPEPPPYRRPPQTERPG
jgi:hypothetical protein